MKVTDAKSFFFSVFRSDRFAPSANYFMILTNFIMFFFYLLTAATYCFHLLKTVVVSFIKKEREAVVHYSSYNKEVYTSTAQKISE